MEKTTHVVKTTGTIGKHEWMILEIIRDNSVTLLDMDRKILGWSLKSVTQQGNADWCGLSADAILAHKLHWHSDYGTVLTGEERANALDLETRAPKILADRANG